MMKKFARRIFNEAGQSDPIYPLVILVVVVVVILLISVGSELLAGQRNPVLICLHVFGMIALLSVMFFVLALLSYVWGRMADELQHRRRQQEVQAALVAAQSLIEEEPPAEKSP